MKKERFDSERGFSLIEVAIASVITLVGLIALASLFTLAMSQNRLISNFGATTAIGQQKIEELNAVEQGDARLGVGGALTEDAKQNGYFDDIYVDSAGVITTIIPPGQTANYRRYWMVETDPALANTVLISVRVVALQPSGGGRTEDTILSTVRSW